MRRTAALGERFLYDISLGGGDARHQVLAKRTNAACGILGSRVFAALTNSSKGNHKATLSDCRPRKAGEGAQLIGGIRIISCSARRGPLTFKVGVRGVFEVRT